MPRQTTAAWLELNLSKRVPLPRPSDRLNFSKMTFQSTQNGVLHHLLGIRGSLYQESAERAEVLLLLLSSRIAGTHGAKPVHPRWRMITSFLFLCDTDLDLIGVLLMNSSRPGSA